MSVVGDIALLLVYAMLCLLPAWGNVSVYRRTKWAWLSWVVACVVTVLYGALCAICISEWCS